jgi:hypothetical protein
MTKRNTILSAALAGVLLSSCATNEPAQEPRADAQGGATPAVTTAGSEVPGKKPLTVEERIGGNGVVVSMEPGPQGGLRIPQQVIVPEVKLKKQGDKSVEAPGHEP